MPIIASIRTVRQVLMNDVLQFPLNYASPYQITMATAISRHKLENLIKPGVIKAKRVDAQTVLIGWDSVRNYIDSLPDVVGETDHVAPQDPMERKGRDGIWEISNCQQCSEFYLVGVLRIRSVDILRIRSVDTPRFHSVFSGAH
jgi:hypothetical protein